MQVVLASLSVKQASSILLSLSSSGSGIFGIFFAPDPEFVQKYPEECVGKHICFRALALHLRIPNF